jgi:hypothetical protein
VWVRGESALAGASQLEAAHLRMSQQVLEICERRRVEVARVLRERHGEHGFDLDPEPDGRLGDQQISPGSHADDEVQVRIRQMLLELAHEGRDGLAQARQLIGIEVTMA